MRKMQQRRRLLTFSLRNFDLMLNSSVKVSKTIYKSLNPWLTFDHQFFQYIFQSWITLREGGVDQASSDQGPSSFYSPRL